ncbi:glycoside hydrolase family 32 protein [Granulicella sibirica]|uniref:Sucrose-6-phosphate hydrolase n=1 Tax=Granulicella sibirica TaxID=2479048 RepID=A0A4Q0SW17_9BACT|nr:glycoside hydrolase family 32 protein [Granulicella sibirica]RXH54987.1 Sucrose-6-phosphate hydrolase [Granulicella sibirica]
MIFQITRLLLAATILSAAAAQTAPAPYNEPFRPQVHFSPRERWMNDPNGLVFFEGEYHLFFQHNPLGDTPGHISWGHAVSTDLLHWHELPVAIPATDKELVFTGSVVVDEKNSSHQCENHQPCLVAIYTAHNDTPHHEAQALAVSQDRGRTWKRFSGNPVLDRNVPEFRDPGVTWNDETKSWLMVVSLPNDHKVVFYTSPDLIEWTELSTFGPAATVSGQWECPNLLKIPTADGKQSLYALKIGVNPGSLQGGSGEQYFLGTFDGHHFTQSSDPGSHGWTDYGKDSYCAISFNHLPAGEPPTLIGWMDDWQYADKLPTVPWRGQMTIPRHLALLKDADGLALQQTPVTAPIRAKSTSLVASITQPTTTLFTTDQPTELTLTIDPADAQTFGLRLYSDPAHWTEVAIDRTTMKLSTDRTHATNITAPDFPARTEAPLSPNRPLDLHLILDRSSVEVFAQNGTTAMTNLTMPTTQNLRVELFRTQGTHPLKVIGQRWTLRSVWSSAQAK